MERCRKITDAGLKKMSQVLNKMISLEKLDLHLDEWISIITRWTMIMIRCDKVTGYFLHSAALKSLQNLHLNFATCPQLSDAAFKELQTLTSLKTLDLRFSSWESS